MIAAWMLYTLVLTSFLAAGALLLERALHLTGRPSRRVWMGAMVAAVGLPLTAWLAGGGTTLEAGGGLGVASPVGELLSRTGPTLFQLDQSLVWMWVGVSGLLAGLVGVSALSVHMGRRRWGRAVLEGVSVRVSDDVGPAVVGFFRSEIVLPRWTFESDALIQTLILRHEREHVREGDQRLLALGLLIVVLMPWNLMLFWMARRLRLAVEIDCDARVLRSSGFDVQTYGALLLEVGSRRGVEVLPVPAFSRPRSLLERRIERMTSRPGKEKWAAALVMVAGLLLLSASYLPAPPTVGEVYAAPSSYACPSDAHRSRKAGARAGDLPLARQEGTTEEVARASKRL